MVFNLNNKVERPVILLDYIFEGCSGLIDTGALIPVWTKNTDSFRTIFPNAKIVEKHRKFSGFGDSAFGDLYRVDFSLKDFVFPQMPIIVCPDDKIPGFFLFSATMFSKMDYEIKNSTKEFVVEAIDNQKCFNICVGNRVLVQ